MSLSSMDDPSAKVRKLCLFGSQVEANPDVPAIRYFRTGQQMLIMATVYHQEGNYESAFVLYNKLVSLFVEKLPKHPGYSSVPQKDRAWIRKKLDSVLHLAENLKPKLMEYYAGLEQERIRVDEENALKKESGKDEEHSLSQKQIPSAPPAPEASGTAALPSVVKEDEMELERLKEAELDKIESRDKNNCFEGENTSTATVGDDISHVPSVDRSNKPMHLASVEFGGIYRGLRKVKVPENISQQFLEFASSNTRMNKETLGILAGSLAYDSFKVTHLIIPKQKGSSDSCETYKEEEIYIVQEQHNLITLGWIHTHPSQTAFLSSIDMHMQSAFQQMLPEAIAIVCAPKYDEVGIFSLTAERGISEIESCSKRGHHLHNNPNGLFETAMHTDMMPSIVATVLDLT